MAWTVRIPGKVAKHVGCMPTAVTEAVAELVRDLESEGPVQTAWPNYGKITGKPDCHHCHVRKGRPTYVVVWRVIDEGVMEVLYVGTHEGANYGRIC